MEKKEIIYGRNPVFEYLKKTSKEDLAELYILKNSQGKIIKDIENEAKKNGVKIFYKDKTFFSKLTSSSKHQGIALKYNKNMSRKNLDENELLNKGKTEEGVLVILDQLTDPHNVGSIIRSAEALGALGIIIPKSNSSDINSTVIKSSAGATAHIDIATVSNIAMFMTKAKDEGYWIIGTSDHGGTDLNKLQELRPLIIVIGSEGKGMRRLTEEKCDSVVRIPLRGHVSSLNASVAAGIILYECFKK